MIDPNIRIFNSPDQMAGHLADLLESMMEYSDRKKITVALSGGSTPKEVFRSMVAGYRDRLEWSKILFFWGDERCVPPDSPESNYRMARENLLDLVPVPTGNIYRIRGEEDPFSEARRYSDLVSKKILHKEDIPAFDLVLLGIGEDGHTASIFPPNLDLFISDRLFDVTENPQTGQLRITATGKIINNARTVVFLVTGRSKAGILSRIIRRKEGWETLPAAMVHSGHGVLEWLLDEEAASEI